MAKICIVDGCDNIATKQCNYCEEYFCSMHLVIRKDAYYCNACDISLFPEEAHELAEDNDMPVKFTNNVQERFEEIYDGLPDEIKADSKKSFFVGVYYGFKLQDLFSSFAYKITMGFLDRIKPKGDEPND